MDDWQAQLSTFIGQEAEPPRVARYPANAAMIRNWVEALDDFNPVYVDSDVATATGRASIVCPPAMISTWVMSGLRRYRRIQELRARGEAEQTPYSHLMTLLDAHGFTSVVATDLEQTYEREVVPGDHVTCEFRIESVSERKSTGLGDGYFITLGKTYRESDSGDVLAVESFRLLRFDPTTRKVRP